MSLIYIGDIGNDADGKGNRDDNVNDDDFRNLETTMKLPSFLHVL